MSKVIGITIGFLYLILAFLVGIDVVEPTKIDTFIVYMVAGTCLIKLASRE